VTGLGVAFKEWAVVCRALADGRQSLILRKGGIAETGGLFRPEHDAFLLYPTFFHEHRAGVKADFLPLLDAADADRPGPGTIRFTHLARVTSVRHVTDLDAALGLDALHAWTADVVRQRFQYRTPGLYVLTVRVYGLPVPATRVERPEYAGCKTWVGLDEPVPADGAVPVLADDAFAAVAARIGR
jgi:hypothetical protein